VENFRRHNTDGFAALNVSAVFFCSITRRHPQLKEFQLFKPRPLEHLVPWFFVSVSSLFSLRSFALEALSKTNGTFSSKAFLSVSVTPVMRSFTRAGVTRLFLCFFSAFATKLHAPVSRFFLSFRLVTKPRAGVSSLRFLYVISLLFLCSFFVFAAKFHARGCGFASLLSLCSFLVLSLFSARTHDELA
jgi:hypothetical protein